MSTGGGDLNSLTLLPNKLKTEIALHVNLETLRKVNHAVKFTKGSFCNRLKMDLTKPRDTKSHFLLHSLSIHSQLVRKIINGILSRFTNNF